MSIIQTNVPVDLTERRQWLLWRQETRGEKPTKVPYTAMGYRASVTNPDHWSEYEYVAGLLRKRPGFADGIGFVFTPEDPYCGIDLDHVWQSDADEGAPWADGILERFADTYSELSPSGKGVKLWCRANAPRCGRWAIESGAIEVYDRARYFTVTGRHAGVLTITDHQHDLERLLENLEDGRGATLSRPIEAVIPQGRRHNTLVSLAGTMWKRGIDADAIEAALLVVNTKQCHPPYSPEHVHKIVESMARWTR
jgi:hypothetical protein